MYYFKIYFFLIVFATQGLGNSFDNLILETTNKNGIPDLIAIPPNSDVLFIEVKKPKGKLSKLQEYRIKELKKYGIKTEVYRGKEESSV